MKVGTKHYRVAQRELNEKQKIQQKKHHFYFLILCLGLLLIFVKGFTLGYVYKKQKHD